MIVRITTDCCFAGCETIHYVEMPDDSTKEQIQKYADDLMQQDIEPWVGWEVSSEEDADEEGYDIE